MKQYPSNLKFKKYHKPPISFLRCTEQQMFLPTFGSYGLKALMAGKLTFNQIEAARRTIRRTIKKEGFFWVNLFTNISLTKKPVASRMGKGKGAHSHWVCAVRKGQILYELAGLPFDISICALNKAGTKLPITTKISRLIY